MKISFLSQVKGKTAEYAISELRRCLFAMDETLTEGKGDASLTLKLTGTDSQDDRISIEVKNGVGVIAGANPCALLIAAYRFLRELGCRWIAPGAHGEILPKKALTAESLTVSLDETPSYRHRGVCIEGAVAEEHVRAMIEFLPRVGMNSYFIQFFRPGAFFNNYHQHVNNVFRSGEPKTAEELDAIHARLVDEIALRGLRHHAIGHGWTCEPFGVPGESWTPVDESKIDPAYLDLTALVNGRRGLHKKVPILTNLCMSKEKVRDTITDAVVAYLKEHPTVSALHLWLGDAYNNMCECPDCAKARPADFYVKMLNELDEKLTREKIDTKIVFLLYFDLLWAPEIEVLHNPSRFILMFAPITRTYSKTYLDGLADTEGMQTAPYQRNKLEIPKRLSSNLAYLFDWQKQFRGDSFVFDYHLMWANSRDLGNAVLAKTIHSDAASLDRLNLNGFISCQLNRNGFPTTLPLYTLAKTLWNKESAYDAICEEYYTAAFGENAKAVQTYLEELSARFNYAYISREDTGIPNEEMAEVYCRLPAYIQEFRASMPDMTLTSANYHMRVLALHADYCLLAARTFEHRARGQARQEWNDAVAAYLSRIEEQIEYSLDVSTMLPFNKIY